MSERDYRPRVGQESAAAPSVRADRRSRRDAADRPAPDHSGDGHPADEPPGEHRQDDVSLPEAFALLGHEDRLAIVATVVRARDAPSREYPVQFSTLRDATGFRDTGRLAYHLGELTGRFLLRTDGGYAVDERGFDVLRVPLAQYADGR